MANYIVTVATESHTDGLAGLVRSLRRVGWEDEVLVFCPRDEVWDPGLSRVAVVPLDPWWETFYPKEQMSRDARFLKPTLPDQFQDDDRILFFDGGDILVYGSPEPLFAGVDNLMVVPAQPDRNGRVLPGWVELFGVAKESIPWWTSGIWMAKVTQETRRFFDLWKALCGWSIAHGEGDMVPFNLAHAVWGVMPGQMETTRTWHWLPDYGNVVWRGEKPFTQDGKAVSCIHGAGTAHTVYDDAYRRMMGRSRRTMKLDEHSRWKPVGLP